MLSAHLPLGKYSETIIFSIKNGPLSPTSVLIILLIVSDPLFTPITRATSLLSLESAIFSVIFSRMYYFRFSHMPVPQIAFCLVSGEPSLDATLTRSLTPIKATRRPVDACNSTSPFWNLWVILALPAIYAVWSTILLIITLMSFAFTPDYIRYTVLDGTPLPSWLLLIVCTAVMPSIAIVCKVRRSFLVL